MIRGQITAWDVCRTRAFLLIVCDTCWLPKVCKVMQKQKPGSCREGRWDSGNAVKLSNSFHSGLWFGPTLSCSHHVTHPQLPSSGDILERVMFHPLCFRFFYVWKLFKGGKHFWVWYNFSSWYVIFSDLISLQTKSTDAQDSTLALQY